MKYILKKEYPNSPKLGTIVEEDDGAYYIPDDDSKLSFTELDHYPYSYPEFWELIVEKDYEILSIKTNANIFSIKRLSDGEIFTVGDKIDSTISDLGRPTELTGFIIQNDKLLFGLRELGYYPLRSIIKSKQPLFTTEDGVDIFEGNEFYFIAQNFSGNTYGKLKAKLGVLAEFSEARFSTKEKAEEYILMNKPVLSLKEVLNKLLNGYLHSSSSVIPQLEDLVKSKLK